MSGQAFTSLVKSELETFSAFFKEQVRSETTLLNIMVNYTLRAKGKQLRPVMVFLSAKLHGKVEKQSYVAASLIELMHTATLIHDDVVDDSHQRRGLFSINALWKNKAAVLLGDFFLAKGLLMSVDNQAFGLLRIMSGAVKEMSEGELMQIKKARMLDIDQPTYFEIIRKKTAVLAAAVSAGAESAGASPELVERMRLFGELLGIAFQIKDDIFDLEPTSLLGKPAGNDIKEQKITLPLLYVIENSTPAEAKRIKSLIKNNSGSSKAVKELILIARERGGIAHAKKVMMEYKQQALNQLLPYPPCDALDALRELADYIIDREK